MVLLENAIEEKKTDIRNLERNLTRGVVHSDEVQKQVKQLPDDAESADWVSIESLQQDKK